MAYNPTSWANGRQGGTSITAARLNHIEDGVDAAHEALDGRLSDAALNATYAPQASPTFTGTVRILRPLNMSGGRSLDAYVLQALLVLAVPLAVAKPWGEVTATLIALAVFCACWGWAETRRIIGIDKLHRAPVAIARRFREPIPAAV